MSDGITEARRGTYWKNDKYDKSIINWELHQKLQNKNTKHMPDQKWHKIISFIKSGVRIVGYALIPFNLVAATIVLIFSEIIGIIEELV